MRKTIGALLAVLVLTVLVWGTRGGQQQERPVESAGYTRVLAISPALEEIALDLVDPEQLVAVSNTSRHSADDRIRAQAAKVKAVVSEKPSTEEIIALHPDIVLIPVVFSRAQADTLRDCGLHVVPLDVPDGYEDVKARIRYIAGQLHAGERGAAVVRAMDRKMSETHRHLAGIEKEKIVVGYSVNGAFGRKNGAFDNICKEARAVNGAGLLNLQRGEHLSKEQIVRLNPDVIICSVSTTRNEIHKDVLSDPALRQTKAVKNGRVLVAEDRFMSSVTQSFPDAVDHIARLVYPECF